MIYRIALIAALLISSFGAWAQTPHQVLKSRTASFQGGFDNAVSVYASELSDWRAHMARAEQDEKNAVPKDKAYQPFPPPIADQEVMASVDIDGHANYIVINDDPPDDKILAAKKASLIARVAQAMDAAVAAISPAGKRPLSSIRESDILQADAVRMKSIMDAQRGVLATIGIGGKTIDELQAEVAKARPITDTNFLKDQTDRRQKIEAIRRAAAQAMSDIEDLTIQNVDAYVVAPLPN